MMNGYVRNQQPTWSHVLKRNVEPGGKIELDDLYEEYGKKHRLNEGKEFVGWLTNVKLKDRNKWKVIFTPEEGVEEVVSETVKEINEIEVEIKQYESVHNEVPVNDEVEKGIADIKDLNVSDVVNLSVRRAREIVPKIMDLKLLKYAIQEAKQLAGKDSLCKILRTRLRNLEIYRR